jgi:cell division septum initiation protein DivIVA
MTNQHESIPDLMHDEPFEVVMRGFSRRQVRDYMIRSTNQIRDLEERLARAIDQAEQGRIELAEARRRLAEAPQDYDELGQRLSQILKLGEEEAAAKREVAEAEAAKLRDDAAAEADRTVTEARQQADNIMNAAQQEAERRVGDATTAAERLLAQAGADAEEALNTARAEADDTLRAARAEADRLLTAAKLESEQTIENARAEAEATLNKARAEAEATLTSAQNRSRALDEHTGARVAYLTDTHTEVMRRLNDLGNVLGDLLHRESVAGPLVPESAVVPPAPSMNAAEQHAEPDVEAVRVIVDEEPAQDRRAIGRGPQEAAAGDAGEGDRAGGDRGGDGGGDGSGARGDAGERGRGAAGQHRTPTGEEMSDDTDVNLGRRMDRPERAGEVRDPFTPARQ